MATAEQRATRAAINTKHVAGRRTARYSSFDDLLADAERLARTPHRTLGNWSLGMILNHLANALNMGIDGGVPPANWLVRLVAGTFLKGRMLRGPMPSGFQLPKAAGKVLIPEETTAEDGLSKLRAAIARWKNESKRSPHPAFGKLSPAEYDLLQLRHAEMHMGFVVPSV